MGKSKSGNLYEEIMPPQKKFLGYQLTLFGSRGTDYARHITTGLPIFLDDAASLLCVHWISFSNKKLTSKVETVKYCTC